MESTVNPSVNPPIKAPMLPGGYSGAAAPPEPVTLLVAAVPRISMDPEPVDSIRPPRLTPREPTSMLLPVINPPEPVNWMGPFSVCSLASSNMAIPPVRPKEVPVKSRVPPVPSNTRLPVPVVCRVPPSMRMPRVSAKFTFELVVTEPPVPLTNRLPPWVATKGKGEKLPSEMMCTP